MKFVIEGNPVPYARVIPKIRKGKRYAVDPRAADKQHARWKLKSQLQEINQQEGSKFPLYDSYEVHLRFYMPISFSCDPKRKKLASWAIEPHNIKPDTDNLTKFIFDVGNGLLWVDDRMISKFSTCKEFSENPRTEITIMVKKSIELDENTRNVFEIIGRSDLSGFCLTANRLAQIASEDIDNLSDEDKAVWMRSTAEILLEFAQRFHKPLSKIAKIKEDKRNVT